MATFTDDFTRADGALGANWAASVGSLTIVSNRVVENVASGLFAREYHNGTTFGPDSYAEAVVNLSGTVGRLNIFLRADADYDNGYHFDGRVGNPNQVYKKNGGSFTSLGSAASALASGVDATIRIEAEGSSITGHVNGTEIISVTDTDHSAAGWCGIGGYRAQYSFDSVDFGDLDDMGVTPEQNAQVGAAFQVAGQVGGQTVLRTYLGSTLIFGTPPA